MYGRRVEYVCAQCGCQFRRRPRKNGGVRKFCSRWCFHVATEQSSPERFWAKKTLAPSGCWEYTGTITCHGYGHVRLSGRLVRAHRYAWTLRNGAIPAGLVVCHSCDNRRCINPEHLFLGTQQENNDDKVRKGRVPRGVTHGNAKFLVQQVLAIRAAWASEPTPSRRAELAKQHGVSEETIRKVVKFITYRYVQAGEQTERVA